MRGPPKALVGSQETLRTAEEGSILTVGALLAQLVFAAMRPLRKVFETPGALVGEKPLHEGRASPE